MRQSESMAVLAVLLVVMPLVSSGRAEITRIDNPSAFSGPRLTFEELRGGTVVTDQVSSYGVRFVTEEGGEIRVEVLTVLPILPPKLDAVLRNGSPGGSSSRLALILSFSTPLRRVGFTLGNGPATALIMAYTARGKLLGETEQPVLEELVGPFVGLETSDPAGISTVVIDYGENPAREQINDLRLEYLQSRSFGIVIPQIAAGHAVGRTVETQIHLQNLGEKTPVEVRFFDTAGKPLSVLLGGEERVVWEGELGRSAHRVLELQSPDGVLLVGYVVVEAPRPVGAQAIYRTLSDTSLPVEAAITAGPGRIWHVASVEVNPTLGLDTGIALVNVSSETARARLYLIDDAGHVLDNGVGLQLAAAEHRALFLTELFGENLEKLGYAKFLGSLEIHSDQPTAATVLRTYCGFSVSSLLVDSQWEPGQPQRSTTEW